jgi:hypothetical protein
MWFWGTSAGVVFILGVYRVLRRRRINPKEGLSVSSAWMAEQRAQRESSDR